MNALNSGDRTALGPEQEARDGLAPDVAHRAGLRRVTGIWDDDELPVRRQSELLTSPRERRREVVVAVHEQRRHEQLAVRQGRRLGRRPRKALTNEPVP